METYETDMLGEPEEENEFAAGHWSDMAGDILVTEIRDCLIENTVDLCREAWVAGREAERTLYRLERPDWRVRALLDDIWPAPADATLELYGDIIKVKLADGRVILVQLPKEEEEVDPRQEGLNDGPEWEPCSSA